MVGDVIASLAAPSIFNLVGYYGIYGINIACYSLVVIILITFVPEPIEKKSSNSMNEKAKFVKKILVDSVKDMFKTVFKKRHGRIRFLLMIQLISYSLLWFNYGYEGLEYLYLLKVYEDFTYAYYSYFSAVKSTVISLFLLLILPKLKNVEPSMFCVISMALQGLTFVLLPWMPNFWMYFGTYILTITYWSAWSNARTLFTLCVSENEIGKIYAAVSIMASMTPLFSGTVYRKIYNAVSTLTSLINVALRLSFLGKYSRPYAVIKDPTVIYF